MSIRRSRVSCSTEAGGETTCWTTESRFDLSRNREMKHRSIWCAFWIGVCYLEKLRSQEFSETVLFVAKFGIETSNCLDEMI